MLEIRQPQDNNRIGGPERPGQTATGGQEAPGRKVLNKNASKTLSDRSRPEDIPRVKCALALRGCEGAIQYINNTIATIYQE